MKKVEEQEIRRVAEHIGRQADAERVVLFGSHARGEATGHSDVDLLVIAPSDLPRFKRSRALYQSLRPYPFAMDLLVYTPEEMKKAPTVAPFLCFCRDARGQNGLCPPRLNLPVRGCAASGIADVLAAGSLLSGLNVPENCFDVVIKSGRVLVAYGSDFGDDRVRLWRLHGWVSVRWVC